MLLHIVARNEAISSFHSNQSRLEAAPADFKNEILKQVQDDKKRQIDYHVNNTIVFETTLFYNGAD
jgi:hypothetical protein